MYMVQNSTSISPLHFNAHFSRTWVSRYQNVSILDFILAKADGGGGDNWSCKTCESLSMLVMIFDCSFYT